MHKFTETFTFIRAVCSNENPVCTMYVIEDDIFPGLVLPGPETGWGQEGRICLLLEKGKHFYIIMLKKVVAYIVYIRKYVIVYLTVDANLSAQYVLKMRKVTVTGNWEFWRPSFGQKT